MISQLIHRKLIETGKALRAADREGGKSLANANSRIRTNIPGVIDNFHQVLDEFESEIVREPVWVKSVILMGRTRSERKQSYYEISKNCEPNDTL